MGLAPVASSYLQLLWENVGIPTKPDWSEWSLDYAREVGQLIVDYVNAFEEDGLTVDMPCLMQALSAMDVFAGGA